MQKYSKYKDSGVKWLGEIPSHWEVKRWRFLLEENCKKNSDCLVRKQLQFRYGDIVQKSNQETDADVLETISKYTVVRPNDIMINGLNLNYDFISQRVAQVREEGAITSAYICLRPTDIANSRYYTYFLKSMDSKKMFHGMGTGIRLTLSYNELKNQFIPKPSYEEQTAIADYLDSVTSKIDEAIAQQQKMIDLLNERKQIIINEAVTKGLDPKAKMKDSEIDWIGQIPEHWEVRSFKMLMSIQRGHDLTAEKFKSGDVPVYGSGGLMGFHNAKTSKAPSIVIGRSGSVGKLQYIEKDFWAHNTVIYMTENKGNDIKYLFYLLKSVDLSALATQTAVPTLDRKNVLSYKIPCCLDIKEQQKISKYLDERLSEIDEVISSERKKISLLQERKQIIINDVVTGKVKVA